jgi:GTP-binding protein
MATTLSSARSRAGSRPGPGTGALASGAEVRLVLAAHRPGERPKNALPALAVLGRSNVGKSSLLNALLGTKVARVSQTPGRTQALYWYRVGDRFDVVDCPGYGFAKTGRETRDLLERLIESLLLGTSEEADAAREAEAGAPRAAAFRPSLALLLIDGRLEPQESDLSMALFLKESSVPAFVAATKWDAVKPSQRVRQLRALSVAFQTSDRPLLPVSSETGENLPALARALRAALAPSWKE